MPFQRKRTYLIMISMLGGVVARRQLAFSGPSLLTKASRPLSSGRGTWELLASREAPEERFGRPKASAAPRDRRYSSTDPAGDIEHRYGRPAGSDGRAPKAPCDTPDPARRNTRAPVFSKAYDASQRKPRQPVTGAWAVQPSASSAIPTTTPSRGSSVLPSYVTSSRFADAAGVAPHTKQALAAMGLST